VLWECANAIAPSLCAFYNYSLSKGEVPAQWKEAHVFPVHKSGPKNIISNYRPISLTSLSYKILERLLSSRFLYHLKNNDLLNRSQHGFLPGRSCVTLLTHALDDWHNALNTRNVKQVDVISLDWAKAFDVVPHDRLLLKLSRCGIVNAAHSWIKTFLADRTQFVSYRGYVSPNVSVPTRVPQGSVIGPLLFIIYMLDFPSGVSSPVVQYADDTSLYRIIKDNDDAEALQSDLATVDIWYKNNEMAYK
jgi:hypothetical protein